MIIDHLVLGASRRKTAIQNSERGVQLIEHRPDFAKFKDLHWDDLHLFRCVAAASSFRKAAVVLGVSVNTVRVHVERLEKSLNTVLFARSRDGICLTAEGVEILDIAIEMQSLSATIVGDLGNNVVTRPGEIRISCSEGLGEFWLTPKLGDLQERLPDHSVTLQNDFDQSRIHSREYDICVGFEKPIDPETIVRKLASVHIMLFASEKYVAKFGMPRSVNDAAHHRFVLQNAPGIHSNVIRLLVGDEASKKLVLAKVNTSHSLYWAIVNGIGIGALPTYARSVSKKVIPLDLPIQFKFELWMSFDRSVRSSKPIRATIDWLEACFDPVTYPWFSENFIHPDDFENKLEGANVVSLFEANDG